MEQQEQKTIGKSDDRLRNIVGLVLAISAILIYGITVYGYTQTGRIDWLNVAVAALSLMLAAKIRRDVKLRQRGAGSRTNEKE